MLCHHLCLSTCCQEAKLSKASDSYNVTWQAKAHVTISDAFAQPTELRGLPQNIILYQYEVCPFCCKLKAFLDFHKVRTISYIPISIAALALWSSAMLPACHLLVRPLRVPVHLSCRSHTGLWK